MGRYDFRAQRVLANANLALETKRISTPPVWHQIVQDIPPPPRLTRPVKQHFTSRNKFRPQQIKYPEDGLRQEFFSDHPWELARPRVVLEDSGNDHRDYDWEGLEQEGKRVDGESVVQRQRHLMKNGYNDQPVTSPSQAYDIARKELYTHRHFQDIERRIAKEEALHSGAYFGPGPNAIAEPLENEKVDRWREWAAKRVSTFSNMRMAGYSGSEVGDEEVGALVEAAVDNDMAAGEDDANTVKIETPRTSQDAVADAVAGVSRR